MLKFHIPIKLPSLANLELHWRAKTSLKEKQKQATKKVLDKLVIPPCPLVITITRIGPKRMDDDNLSSACKYVRDEIARAVGVDDGSDIYTWVYKQEIGVYGVDVTVETRDDD